jgi:hypothetical protein
MPAVWRQIGPEFQNNKGVTTKPKALITWCAGCKFEGAMFGDGTEWWCGWINGTPVCVKRGEDERI